MMQNSLRIISSESKGAGVFYMPARESYRMRPAEEGGILIPQNQPAIHGQSGLWRQPSDTEKQLEAH